MRPPAEATDRRVVVLFDLDGVLTSKDTFTLFVGRRLRKKPWRLLLAAPALPALALTGNLPTFRAPLARHLVRVALLGADLSEAHRELEAIGGEFAATPDWLHADGVRRAQDHLHAGDRVIVVTASERLLARTLLDRLGLEEAELVASELADVRGGLQLNPHNYGSGKRDALEARGVAQPWATMYTDSIADLPTLRATVEQVLVNPSPRLQRRLQKLAGSRLSVERWQ
jgi:phosphatidylglycerophosphatase C